MKWTRQALVPLLRERGLRPKRSFGQNFLLDENFLDAIVRDAGVGPQDGVIEVGSGPGNLTDRLAARAGHVWAFEVDPELHALSRELLAGRANVTLVRADAADFARHVDPGASRRLKVVSNLPYADWQRLLLHLLSTPLPVESYTLMLQADVVERLRARPGTKEYGPLPALVQGACAVRKLRRAGRALFWPQPRVDSVLFEVRRQVPPADFVGAEAALRRLFVHRRKKSAAAGGRRVEELSPRELLALALPGSS
jgi:16S rRNA (adenine1518-N6/adenine1519-N6)-dimethyltransferase